MYIQGTCVSLYKEKRNEWDLESRVYFIILYERKQYVMQELRCDYLSYRHFNF